MAKDKGLLFFYDWKPVFEELPPEDCKALIIAMIDFKQNQIPPPEFTGAAKIAALLIFPAIDRSEKLSAAGRNGGLKAQQTLRDASCDNESDSRQAPEPASSHGTSTKQNKTETKQDKDRITVGENPTAEMPSSPSTPTRAEEFSEEKEADKPKKNRPQFIPPTAEEVREYCAERGNSVDPERFVDFYSAKGWMVGKNKMCDWKSAVRTWERDDQEGNSGSTYKTAGSKKTNHPEMSSFDGDEAWNAALRRSYAGLPDQSVIA